MSYLAGEDMHGGYGGADILRGCSVAVARGEIVVIVGPNGAGKSTAMKALCRHGAAAPGRGAPRRRSDRPADPAGPGQAGHGLRTADRQHIRDALGSRKSRNGRLPAPRRHFGQHRARLRPVPGARGEAPPARRRAVRRPAPAGGDRARADDPAGRADARRAHRRGVADRDGRAVRPHPRNPPRRDRHPDGRAERPPGARHRGSRLRAGDREEPLHRQRTGFWPTRKSGAPSSAAERRCRSTSSTRWSCWRTSSSCRPSPTARSSPWARSGSPWSTASSASPISPTAT